MFFHFKSNGLFAIFVILKKSHEKTKSKNVYQRIWLKIFKNRQQFFTIFKKGSAIS